MITLLHRDVFLCRTRHQAALPRTQHTVRKLMRAAEGLRRAGLLTPDNDPEAYVHSNQHWAIWAREQGFDARTYTDAFIDPTRKNVDAAEQSWTAQVDTAVRSLVPRRWQEVQLLR